jgi:hypothetical protein
MSVLFASYSTIDWKGLLQSYASLAGNATNNNSSKTFNGSILGNNTSGGSFK